MFTKTLLKRDGALIPANPGMLGRPLARNRTVPYDLVSAIIAASYDITCTRYCRKTKDGTSDGRP
jgi:hypothetical protein